MTSKYDSLNDMQKKATFHTEGPLLVLAGAGSGKTRVLTHRVAYLIEEKKVKPWSIMAITFTNKAADEMRSRVMDIVGFGADQVWISTFHSACVRMLRRYGDRLGYGNNFTIYDTADSVKLITGIYKDMNLDPKQLSCRKGHSIISSYKNAGLCYEDMKKSAGNNMENLAEVFRRYQLALKSNNAMDFDDILINGLLLLKNNPDVLENYQERLRYIMVDEFQDTNALQFSFVKILAAKHKNICVVGDDDQSIYGFRGADVTNILNFESSFPGTCVIRLEQNYRSTKNILNAANNVIAHNRDRKEKTLWCDNDFGDLIDLYRAKDAYDEADMISSTIAGLKRSGYYEYGDFAVLYRNHAMSRALEEKLIKRNIPYRIYKGLEFYSRQEIKDIIAYLKVIDNPCDDVSVERVINVPKRGIGAATVTRLYDFANENNICLLEAVNRASEASGVSGKTLERVLKFSEMMEELGGIASEMPVDDFLTEVYVKTGYQDMLIDSGDDSAIGRMENIGELISKAQDYMEENPDGNLRGFLEDVALVSDVDDMEEDSNFVSLITMHSAKGLEFPYVFICGMEEGLFPSDMDMAGSEDNCEEERRLCYVAMTRAKKHLTLSMAVNRTVNGMYRPGRLSRFVKEIPEDLMTGDRVSDIIADEESLDSFDEFGDADYGEGLYGGGYNKSAGYSTGHKGYGTGSKNYRGYGMAGSRERGRNMSSRTFADSEHQLAKKVMSRKPDYSTGGKPVLGSELKAAKTEIDYGVGDRVSHVKFGEGTVKEIVEGPKDYQVTIEFDTRGTRVMMAGFAKLKKC